jgi:hypothetical protein
MLGLGEARRRSIARARLSFNPTLPRAGRVATQAHRCLIANNGLATVTQLKAWCYAGREHRHWQYEVIREALRRLGARPIGRAHGIGRPGIWVAPNKPGCCQSVAKTMHLPK